MLGWFHRWRIKELEMRQIELLGRLEDIAKGRYSITYKRLANELNGVNAALRDSRVATAQCAHEWQGEGPPPRRWSCACGTLVYRSYEDYVDD